MTYEVREIDGPLNREIIESFNVIDEVLISFHKKTPQDMSVCAELSKIKPHIFANGGDRKPNGDPVPEVALCEKLRIDLAYNVGKGGKVQSSSWLIGKVKK